MRSPITNDHLPAFRSRLFLLIYLVETRFKVMPSDNSLVLDREDKVLQIFPRPPILTSSQAGWDGIALGYMCQPAYEVPEMYSPRWHSIAIGSVKVS